MTLKWISNFVSHVNGDIRQYCLRKTCSQSKSIARSGKVHRLFATEPKIALNGGLLKQIAHLQAVPNENLLQGHLVRRSMSSMAVESNCKIIKVSKRKLCNSARSQSNYQLARQHSKIKQPSLSGNLQKYHFGYSIESKSTISSRSDHCKMVREVISMCQREHNQKLAQLSRPGNHGRIGYRETAHIAQNPKPHSSKICLHKASKVADLSKAPKENLLQRPKVHNAFNEMSLRLKKNPFTGKLELIHVPTEVEKKMYQMKAQDAEIMRERFLADLASLDGIIKNTDVITKDISRHMVMLKEITSQRDMTMKAFIRQVAMPFFTASRKIGMTSKYTTARPKDTAQKGKFNSTEPLAKKPLPKPVPGIVAEKGHFQNQKPRINASLPQKPILERCPPGPPIPTKADQCSSGGYQRKSNLYNVVKELQASKLARGTQIHMPKVSTTPQKRVITSPAKSAEQHREVNKGSTPANGCFPRNSQESAEGISSQDRVKQIRNVTPTDELLHECKYCGLVHYDDKELCPLKEALNLFSPINHRSSKSKELLCTQFLSTIQNRLYIPGEKLLGESDFSVLPNKNHPTEQKSLVLSDNCLNTNLSISMKPEKKKNTKFLKNFQQTRDLNPEDVNKLQNCLETVLQDLFQKYHINKKNARLLKGHIEFEVEGEPVPPKVQKKSSNDSRCTKLCNARAAPIWDVNKNDSGHILKPTESLIEISQDIHKGANGLSVKYAVKNPVKQSALVAIPEARKSKGSPDIIPEKPSIDGPTEKPQPTTKSVGIKEHKCASSVVPLQGKTSTASEEADSSKQPKLSSGSSSKNVTAVFPKIDWALSPKPMVLLSPSNRRKSNDSSGPHWTPSKSNSTTPGFGMKNDIKSDVIQYNQAPQEGIPKEMVGNSKCQQPLKDQIATKKEKSRIPRLRQVASSKTTPTAEGNPKNGSECEQEDKKPKIRPICNGAFEFQEMVAKSLNVKPCELKFLQQRMRRDRERERARQEKLAKEKESSNLVCYEEKLPEVSDKCAQLEKSIVGNNQEKEWWLSKCENLAGQTPKKKSSNTMSSLKDTLSSILKRVTAPKTVEAAKTKSSHEPCSSSVALTQPPTSKPIPKEEEEEVEEKSPLPETHQREDCDANDVCIKSMELNKACQQMKKDNCEKHGMSREPDGKKGFQEHVKDTMAEVDICAKEFEEISAKVKSIHSQEDKSVDRPKSSRKLLKTNVVTFPDPCINLAEQSKKQTCNRNRKAEEKEAIEAGEQHKGRDNEVWEIYMRPTKTQCEAMGNVEEIVGVIYLPSSYTGDPDNKSNMDMVDLEQEDPPRSSAQNSKHGLTKPVFPVDPNKGRSLSSSTALALRSNSSSNVQLPYSSSKRLKSQRIRVPTKRRIYLRRRKRQYRKKWDRSSMTKEFAEHESLHNQLINACNRMRHTAELFYSKLLEACHKYKD